MSSGIVQEPGFDTKVQQFTPIRSAPVWRRAVRKYHCEEDVAFSSEFRQLQFKIHCQEKNLVINDARLVFPLLLTAFKGDPKDANNPSVRQSMAVIDGKPACNIAIAQNAPWNAFETVNTVVNTKVYTEKPRAYGKMLSKCYQSVSELQFQNNHSLKPYANLNKYGGEPVQNTYNTLTAAGAETGYSVNIEQYRFAPSSFSLQNANSGFLERSRNFQDGLNANGEYWKGEISSLLNTGPFSAESRGQGNDQIPYVEDLFLSCTFKQTKCQVDANLLPTQFPDYRKVIVQSLFEFLTPLNAQDFKETDKFNHNLDYPDYFQLQWTGKPYVQIEWIQYAPSALLPAYRLQGFQYKLRKSNEFALPMTSSIDTRKVVPVRLSLQCLSVPNKIYIWAEGTESSMRDSFLWGGMFRTCEIVNNSLMVRVNGESHIIDRPDNQSILFKWWKRHSNSVQEYPTWQKNMVIILTPNEIGLNSWLENDAQLSTIEISCDVRLSRLQQIEYEGAEAEHFLVQSGIGESSHNAGRRDFYYYQDLQIGVNHSDLWGDTSTGTSNRLRFVTYLRNKALAAGSLVSWVPQTTDAVFCL